MSNIFLIADLINKDLIVRRYANQNRWTACFEHCEVKGNGVLSGVYGDGTTMAFAIEDYVKSIAGKTIVFNALDKERRVEFVMPLNLSFLT